ncbi:MAG: TPM domain-containing protein [Gammaproteobacteria bacterium]
MTSRWLQNLTTTHFALRRCFPLSTLPAIDAAIAASERDHRAEIRCAIETALPLRALFGGVGSAVRATEVFSALGVGNTTGNNGVLVYVLLAERSIEIVADRGFTGLVAAAEWEAICREMEAAFRAGHYEQGTLAALERIGALARRHFPADGSDRNELPDRTVLL